MKKMICLNACFRDGSRTAKLAEYYLGKCQGEVVMIQVEDMISGALDREKLKMYNLAVAEHRFDDPMFDLPKKFAEADEILIASPFWNFSIPAALHACLEIICTQGITFDMSPEGQYYSLCKAKKLTYVTTAGGYIPENDHAFGYIRTLAEAFWGVREIEYHKADGLDIYGTDVEAELKKAMI